MERKSLFRHSRWRSAFRSRASVWVAVWVFGAAVCGMAETYSLSSPDKTVQVGITVSSDLSYTVNMDQDTQPRGKMSS